MLLFWIVILLKYPAVPRFASETTTAVALFAPLMIVEFFKVEFKIGLVPVEPNNRTDGEVVLVLVIVRSLVVVPLLDPSMVTLSEKILIKAPLASVPVSVDVTPVFGLINNVNGPPQPAIV